MKKLLKWGLIGFVALIVIGALSGSGDSKPASTTSNTAEEEVREPMIIEVEALGDAFDENQVAAETEWKGKYVQFSAEISNITETGISFQNVATKEFSLTQISCKIKDKNQLLSLKNGQMATVRGVVGAQFVGVIEVKECEVL